MFRSAAIAAIITLLIPSLRGTLAYVPVSKVQHRQVVHLQSIAPGRRRAVPLSGEEAFSDSATDGAVPGGAAADWRDVRAALVSNHGNRAPRAVPGAGWVHGCPVVELGTVLLAATGAFALTRPELHKAVALVLRHCADGMGERSVAVVLNRADPSSEGPGFGGVGSLRRRLVVSRPQQEFAGSAAMPNESDGAGLSVLRGIRAVDGEGSLPEASHVLADIVGELSWAPGELQAEVDAGKWVAAAADSTALLHALTVSAPGQRGSRGRHGADVWEHLTQCVLEATTPNLPAAATRSPSLDTVGDELLEQWAEDYWGLRGQVETKPPLFPAVRGEVTAPGAGSLILTGAHAFSSGAHQHLHKAVLLVLSVNDDEVVAVCLNRPVAQPSRAALRSPSPKMQRQARGLFPSRPLSSSSSLLRPAGSASREGGDTVVHFGGSDDWDRWTGLIASGGTPPPSASLAAVPLGDSGLWRCRSASDAWQLLRRSNGGAASCSPSSMFLRGVVRFGLWELELLQRRGQVGVVETARLSPALRDVLASCAAYRGPAGSGVRLGLYGDHHGFGLWERSVSHAFHGGDDHAATAVRGAVGDRALREWAASCLGPDIGTPCE